jgi:uncharacterized membrane protein
VTDRDVLGRVGVLLALLGVGIAGYLTLVHYTGLEPACTGGGGCEKVQTSEYADVAGIPVALLGLLGYLAIGGALLVLRDEPGLLVPAGLAVVGTAFSGYLQYRSLVDVDATCIWCMASAVTMTLLAAVLLARAIRAP